MSKNDGEGGKIKQKSLKKNILWNKRTYIDGPTQIADCKVGLHVWQIALKNVIYLYVQNIHTYPLYKSMHHLITSTKRPKMVYHGIFVYVQSGVNQNEYDECYDF